MEWLSIIPFLVVIPLAIWTKQVLPGLIVGLIVGSYLVEPSVIGGIQQTIAYIVQSLVTESNIKVLIFLYAFSGLVGMIKNAGGIRGFVEISSEKVQTKKEAIILTWLSTVGTFSAPNFRIVTVAPIMKALLDKIKMSKQELAFVIETTSAPLIALVPIATASVGYMVSLIETSLQHQGINEEAYPLFIRSIPFNFFSIVIILLGVYLSFFHRSKKSATDAEGKEDVEKEEDWHNCHPAVSKDLPARPWNLIIPLILVIGLTLFLTWWDGHSKGFGFFEAFINADVLTAMVIALIVTILVSAVIFMIQKNKLVDLIARFVEGGNELMSVILLLAVVWGLTASAQDLGFSEFVTSNVNWIPTMFVPPALFILGSIISYFVGSSWGTWGILMPLGVSLGVVSGAPLALVIGAVFASGAFGAFASPLSDNTNTIGKILDLTVIKYARFKLKPALIAAGISAVLYGAVTFVL
ncbi:MAG TPA: Na+/H+ antiporter NhaC family protein [Bacillales bacterium]|nr:Na+/H+ antiporter NhaC family protein [Bacillales bacterium]